MNEIKTRYLATVGRKIKPLTKTSQSNPEANQHHQQRDKKEKKQQRQIEDVVTISDEAKRLCGMSD